MLGLTLRPPNALGFCRRLGARRAPPNGRSASPCWAA